MPPWWHRHRLSYTRQETATTEPTINIIEPFLSFTTSDTPGRACIALANPTDEDLRDVIVRTGGHFSDDSVGVVESSAKDKIFDTVPAQGSVVIERPDNDELDEFVIWWTVSYAGRQDSLQFALFKGRDAIACEDVPVLGGSRALIPRMLAR